MASFFEEIGAFDRPFVDVTVKVGGKETTLQSRLPSAQEQDSMEAYFTNEHAKALTEMTQPRNGGPCELDTMRSMYSARPDADLINQLLGTRNQEVKKKAVELSGINLLKEYVRIKALPEAEQAAAFAENDDKIAEFIGPAREHIAAEYEGCSHDELVEQTAQVAINIKALAKANRSLGAQYLYFTLYRPGENPKRAFESTDQVRDQLSPETIESITQAIRAAIEKDADLPPDSPEGSAPDGRSSSPSTSAAVTTTSGEPTATTPADSNSSSTPA